MDFVKLYEDDIPSVKALTGELGTWEILWKMYKGPLPTNISETLKLVPYFKGYENVKKSTDYLRNPSNNFMRV